MFGFGMFGFGMLFMFLFWIASIVLWISALIDILKSDFRGGSDKIVWLLVVVFLPLLGAILYFTIGKNQKINKPAGDGSQNNPR
ncbi:MAG: PLDc N-terminal domain-containing protein [Deltaproteobacteria bacterium]|nr:PLDc N-terminal domain-containing protein [Deltaproteobacteria bacterium]